MAEIEVLVRDYGQQLGDLCPAVSVEELQERLERTAVEEHCGDDPIVDYVLQPDESTTSDEPTTPARRHLRIGIVAAVAAAILLVVGVTVVMDTGSSEDVATDPASAPGETDPAAAPEVADPPVTPQAEDPWPPVPDGFGCGNPTVWPQICDASSFDGAAMYAVTAGGPGLVAVGTNQGCCNQDFFYSERQDLDVDSVEYAVVWTSPDGLTWTRVPHDEAVFGGPGRQNMVSVTAGGPGLVAVGIDAPISEAEANAAVWTSADGLTWTRVPHDEAVFGGPGRQNMVSVTAGGPGLVAVGIDAPISEAEANAAVWTSADGLTWTRVPRDRAVFGGESRQRMLSVTSGGPGLVAVGSDGHPAGIYDIELGADAAVWTSGDGLTWTRVAHDEAIFGGPGEQQMNGVTEGGPGLVAVGSASKESLDDAGSDEPAYENHDAAVWTSTDGLTWSRVPHDEAVFAVSNTWGDLTEIMLSVTAGGPGLVAVGFDSADQCTYEAAVWTSPDGLTWSQVPSERSCAEANGGQGYEQMYSVTVGSSGLVAVGWEGLYDSLIAGVWVTSLEN